MKGHRIIGTIITLILIFNLFSCDQLNFHSKQNASQSSDGSESQQQVQKITYVYSVTQKVLHLPACYYVESMNPDYIKYYQGDIGQLLEQGYSICTHCLVSDSSGEEEDEVVQADPDEVPADEATFVINRSKLTIHMKDCYNIDRMSEKNIKYTCLTLEELLEKEHIPCGNCMPDEYAAYKEAHPELFEKEEE